MTLDFVNPGLKQTGLQGPSAFEKNSLIELPPKDLSNLSSGVSGLRLLLAKKELELLWRIGAKGDAFAGV